MSPKKRRDAKTPVGTCKQCPPGSKRPSPYPGPRCATHHREVTKNRSKSSRDSRLRRTYNISSETYEKIYESQGGLCAICGPYSGRNGKTRNLSVDHDHSCCNGPKSCGKCVRGLICDLCNKYLGLLRDNPEGFQRGIDYLTNPPARKVITDD